MLKIITFFAPLLLVGFLNISAIAQTPLQKAQGFLEQGLPEEAGRELTPLMEKNPSDPQARMLLGTVELQQGNLVGAIAQYQQSLILASNPHDQLVIYNNLINAIELTIARWQKTLSYVQKEDNSSEITKITEQIRQKKQLLTDYQLRAITIADSLPPSASGALAYLKAKQTEKAAIVLDKLPPSSLKVQRLISLSQLLRNPTSSLEQALILSQTLTDKRGEAQTLRELGKYYYQEQNYPQALQMTQRAIGVASQLLDYDLLYSLYRQQGQIYQSLQRFEESKLSYQWAIAALQAIRPQLVSPNPQVQLKFLKEIEPIYREYLVILLKNEPNQANQANLKEARDIFELLQISQLENLFQDTCLTASRTNLEDYLSENRSALIHTILLPESFHVLVSLPNGQILHKAYPLKQSAMETQLIKWRLELENISNNNYRFEGSQLYALIIRPFKAALAQSQVEQLLFISDGLFRNVPPSAFFDQEKQQHLIEQYPVTQVLGINFLTSPKRELGSLLGFGLSEARPPFNRPLLYVEKELKVITALIPGSYYLNQSFTPNSLRQQILREQPSLLHLATHAQFTGDPDSSLLSTYQSPITLRQLETLMELSPKLRLLILSACQTSSGNDLAVLGLVGVAVRSGVPAALGSLWYADDSATEEFIEDFYGHLRVNSPIKALQQAQIQQIHQNSHPNNWSNFILVGN